MGIADKLELEIANLCNISERLIDVKERTYGFVITIPSDLQEMAKITNLDVKMRNILKNRFKLELQTVVIVNDSINFILLKDSRIRQKVFSVCKN